jgi:hypothetical protein
MLIVVDSNYAQRKEQHLREFIPIEKLSTGQALYLSRVYPNHTLVGDRSSYCKWELSMMNAIPSNHLQWAFAVSLHAALAD